MVPESDDARTEVRLMMDYTVTVPLWGEDGQTDGEEWDLSPTLRADLVAFAERWEASVAPATYDDRFDHRPALRDLNELRHRVVDRMTGRSRRRADERRALRVAGEQLRTRLAEELGPDFVVTYVP